MEKLNLPSFDYNIREIEGKRSIFDILRKKFVALTPEEWVRQHFIHLLINHYRYPKALMKIETGLKYNQLNKRSDIMVYDRLGNPFLIIECKSADIQVSEKTFAQASVYNSTIKARYVAVTNGLKTFCCHINHEAGSFEFVKDIPLMDII